MKILENYWKFFGCKTFASRSEIKFFLDGSFAICQGKNVDVYMYNNETFILIQHFDNALVLDNGCIVDIGAKSGIDVYNRSTLICHFDCDTKKAVLASRNSFVAFDNGLSCISLFTVLDSQGTNEIIPLYKDVKINSFDILPNGYSFFSITDSGRLNAMHMADTNGKTTYLDGVYQVDCLKNGCYIVREYSSCTLYDAKMNKILSSSIPTGIRIIGDSYVLYEDNLIFDTEKLRVLKKYSMEKLVAPNAILIYPYRIYDFVHKKEGFWFENEGMKIYRIEQLNLDLIGYWHDSKFYFVSLSSSTSEQLEKLVPHPMSRIKEDEKIYRELTETMLLF